LLPQPQSQPQQPPPQLHPTTHRHHHHSTPTNTNTNITNTTNTNTTNTNTTNINTNINTTKTDTHHAPTHPIPGFIFLFNPNMITLNTTLIVDESIGVTRPNPSSDIVWDVTELYPDNGTVVGEWTYNESVVVAVGGSDARVLHIAPRVKAAYGTSLDRHHHQQRNGPVVVGVASSEVTYTEKLHRVSVIGATGRTGSEVEVVVRGAPPTAAVTVNNIVCSSSNNSNSNSSAVANGGNALPRVRVRFGGAPIHHAMPISNTSVPPGFTGGSWTTSFTVDPAIGEQLSSRAKAYPIPWDPADYKATWLVPHRLILNVFVENPADSMAIKLTVDGVVQTLQPGYVHILAV
jgi:hypothetical protein